jgi:hypothetical protein
MGGDPEFDVETVCQLAGRGVFEIGSQQADLINSCPRRDGGRLGG